LVVREGGVPLTRLERMLIGVSFKFAAVDPREDSLPTPTDFIGQLISKVVNQIDAGSPNGFEDALKEAVDFHSFALDAQNTRDAKAYQARHSPERSADSIEQMLLPWIWSPRQARRRAR
jgi:hypothetical protein